MSKKTENNQRDISGVIQQIIETNSLNQSKFAEMINVNQSQVSDWISGKSKPSYDSLIDICKTFNVSGDFLLGLAEDNLQMKYKIENRRYTGSKTKLIPWIDKIIMENCKSCRSFCDIFAGTGVVAASLLANFDHIIINDFLYSNETIYKAFFGEGSYDLTKLIDYKNRFNSLDACKLEENYVSENYGNKYFHNNDALLIGYLRQFIEDEKICKKINDREYNILLASLLYSLDKCANTVGHYEAYLHTSNLMPSFKFDLIDPLDEQIGDKIVDIYRCDANQLASDIKADVVYIDPPYSSRQYSRFYHVLETITKWDKPTLSGIAMKPPLENLSDYCSSSAKNAFEDLVAKLKCKYIVVSYNNTYNSRSESSKNKITLEDINIILSSKGRTRRFDTPFKAFNAGKTDIEDHKEFLFVTEVGVFEKKNRKDSKSSMRSPFFYVGDKYKLMDQLLKYFPNNIDKYIEPFCGGGSSFLNVKANSYILNDIDSYMINLHKMLNKYSSNRKEFFNKIKEIENHYNLSASYRQDIVPQNLKAKYPKTYFARFNKKGYEEMREDFNKDKNNTELLYVLLIYGFNRMIRFNCEGNFNLPVGNVDMNDNVIRALNNYFDFCVERKIDYSNYDFRAFLKRTNITQNDFIYLDPPYLISRSEYNKLWGEKDELDLLNELDNLSKRGIKFAISNLIEDKGRINKIFETWSLKYNVYEIDSWYINYHDNSAPSYHREVLVTNFKEGH